MQSGAQARYLTMVACNPLQHLRESLVEFTIKMRLCVVHLFIRVKTKKETLVITQSYRLMILDATSGNTPYIYIVNLIMRPVFVRFSFLWMYVCQCIDVYVMQCIHTCVHAMMCVFVCVCVCVCIYMCVCVCVCVYIYIHVYIYIYIYTYGYINIYVCVYLFICMYSYIHIYITVLPMYICMSEVYHTRAWINYIIHKYEFRRSKWHTRTYESI